jgi:hypothetical protein
MTLNELINKFGKSYKPGKHIFNIEIELRNAIDNDFEDQFREFALFNGYDSLIENEDYVTFTEMIEDCVAGYVEIEIPDGE